MAGPRQREQHGHTLLELLAVLAMTILLAAAALPSLQDMLARQRLRAASNDVFSAIELTRALAMARGQRVLLMPAGSGGLDWRLGWLVFVDRNANVAYDAGDELLLRQGPLAGGIEVRFGFTSAAKPLYIAYNGAGAVAAPRNSPGGALGHAVLDFGKSGTTY